MIDDGESGRYSAESIRGFALSVPDQLHESLSLQLAPIGRKGRVCMFGVGNSATAGQVMKVYLDSVAKENVPLICGGEVPGWIGPNDCAILISYSGESHDILEAYDRLRTIGTEIFCIVGGGRLRENAERDGVFIMELPRDIPSRAVFGYTLGYLSLLIQALGVVDAADRLSECLDDVRKYIDSASSSDYLDDKAALFIDRIPAVYTTSDLLPVARRMRDDLYQNCGMISFYGELPEYDHNEIVGWAYPNAHAPNLSMFALRGKDETPLMNVIIDSMIKTLGEFGRDVTVFDVPGDDVLVSNILGCVTADLISARIKEMIG